MSDFQFKEKYNVYDLALIVKKLRGENGCPWDKVQTHQTIRKDFLEEVYEVIEAIDADSVPMMKEELGDVLLQVVFHCEIETEKKNFDLDDVADDICKKLIIRHPHVFGDVNVKNTEEVLVNWENIKQETKGQESYSDTLESVPKVFPALMRGQKLGKRAARAGMDFEDVSGAVFSLESEVCELKKEIAKGNTKDIENELGDVLFSCCNVARLMGLDAEEALQRANEKFIERFKKVEELTRLDGIDMKSLGINELDCYWQKAKII
ncbi:MAG: nucleoside triphosphate pyrophosphohydrolase [Oscillospiraceae bacterium]|nr:nucleoside triphosphate pyrophosphohydrolase [Oscillospiraceae bacterium]